MAADVVTVTVNPALDLSFDVDQLVPDHKLRASGARREAGGGGVNVSRVLKRLGIDSRTVVALGGPTGDELLALMAHEGLDVIEHRIPQNSRESIAITETLSGKQFRAVLPGPPIPDPDVLLTKIGAAAEGARVVVVSGSASTDLAPGFINDVVDGLGPDVLTVIDTVGDALGAAARGGATLLKPSQRELEGLVGWTPVDAGEIERACREVLELGRVAGVVASRGPSGAVLVQRDGPTVWFRPPIVQPVSTVGAGDSMVAGIASALVGGDDLAEAVTMGVACGTAAVTTPGTELCRRPDAERFAEQVVVTTGLAPAG